MAQDETYRTLVYLERGGDRLVAGSGGVIALESGAVLSMISSAKFGLAGGNINVDDLRRLMSEYQGDTVVIEPVALAVNLAVSNLPKNVRTVRIYGSDAAQSMSFWLTAVSAGREVFIFLQGDSVGTFTNASTQIDVSTSGCIILGSLGGAISGFEMGTSLASDCWVHLMAVADNVWAIVAQDGNVVG